MCGILLSWRRAAGNIIMNGCCMFYVRSCPKKCLSMRWGRMIVYSSEQLTNSNVTFFFSKVCHPK